MKARQPLRRSWTSALREVLGPVEGTTMARAMQAAYPEVLRQAPSSTQLKRRLRLHFRCSIAAYRAMQARGVRDPVAALMAVSDVRFRPLVRVLRTLAKLPIPWSITGRVLAYVVPRFTPAPGWVWLVTTEPGAVTCNAYMCFYHRTYTSLGVPELTPVACYSDDLLFPHLPGGVRMVRTGTIGRGQGRCDFRFETSPPATRSR